MTIILKKGGNKSYNNDASEKLEFDNGMRIVLNAITGDWEIDLSVCKPISATAAQMLVNNILKGKDDCIAQLIYFLKQV